MANNITIPGCTEECDAHLHHLIEITHKYSLVLYWKKVILKVEHEVCAVAHVMEW